MTPIHLQDKQFMTKKIIFFDIDGTLYHNGTVLDSTIKTIKELKKKGHYIIIATGRSLGQCENILDDIHPDGVIANNGKYAELFGKVIFEDAIDKDVMERLFYDFTGEGLAYSFSSLEGYMTTLKDNSLITEFAEYFNIKYPELVTSDYYKTKKIFSLGVYHRHPVEDIISKYSELTFMPVNSLGYDVVGVGGEKGQSIPLFLKALNIDFKDTIALGDNTNDISLIDSVYDGIAMGQGHPTLKEHAKHITKSVDEHGLRYAFTNILNLIEEGL